MGKKSSNDGFLSSVSKLGQKLKEQKIIRITIKRDLVQSYPQLRKKLKHPQKNDLINRIRTSIEQPEAIAPLVIRASNNDKNQVTVSTIVNATQVNTFSNQLSNILRLFCFDRQLRGVKKVIRKATPADPKSKTQARLREKKRRNKERRVKRNQMAREKKREIQRQKTFASKQQK